MSSPEREDEDAKRRTPPGASLEELEQLFQQAPVGICMVDRDCCYLQCNDAYAEIVGYEPLDLVGRHMLEVIPESAREGAVAAARQVMESGEPIRDLELRRFTEDAPGNERTWLINVLPVRRNGEITGSMAALQNITAAAQAERKARERLNELEAIYHNAPVGLAFIDRDLRYQRANQIIADLNGVTIEEVVGKTYRDLSPETADTAEPFLRKVVEEGRSLRNVEVRSRPPSDPDHEHVFQLSLDPVRDALGEITGHTSSIQDVTELRRAEEASIQRLQELEILYTHTPVGLCFVDTELRVLHLNPLFSELSHLPQDKQIGAELSELLPQAIGAQMIPQMRYAIRTGVASLRVGVRGSKQGSDARQSTWLADAHPVRTGGIVTGVVSVLQDVTPQAERQHELETIRDRLTEAQRVARVGSWEWNILDDTLWFSEEMRKTFPDARLDPSFSELVDRIHPEDRQKFRAQIDRTLQDDSPYRETFRVGREDGTERVIFAAARLVRTPDGHPARLIGTSQDVTDLGPIARQDPEDE